jgi:uncharacterized membrane protein HdeD (DUF308 family)
MSVDPLQFVVLAAVITGVTELINRLRAKDYWVALTIATAAVIGGVFGALHYYANLDIANGIAVGFGASGALSALGAIGKKSTPAPSSVTSK